MRLFFFRLFFILLTFLFVEEVDTSTTPDVSLRIYNRKINLEVFPLIEKNQKRTPEDICYLNFRLKNLNLASLNIEGEIKGALKFEKNKVILNLNSKGLFLQGISLGEASIYVVYSQKKLIISYFKTKSMVISGEINFLEAKPRLKIEVDIKGLRMSEFKKIVPDFDIPLEGDFRGKIFIEGKFSSLRIRGKLNGFQGKFERFEFKEANLNFKGIYPYLNFQDSYMLIRERNIRLEGLINLSRVSFLQSSNSKRKSEKKDFKGFLYSKRPESLIYKFGKDSFLKLSLEQESEGIRTEINF